MAALTYNGIDLSYILTKSIDQGPFYDPSRTDQIYTRIVLRVQSIVSLGTSPASGDADATAIAARIRHMLTRPRRALVYSVGGSTYLNIAEASGRTGGDDANGPKPLEGCRVVPCGTASYLVEWGVEVCITDCAAGESTGHESRGYLSLRWTETSTIDANWYTTKRRSGLLIVSSRGRDEPDKLRNIVTPGVDQGFRRESAEYSLSEDGLNYRFSFADKQLHRPPPFPATKMSGSMIESVPLPGAKRRGMVHVRLEGPPGVPARDMLNTAIAVCMQRANEGDIYQGKGGKLFVGGSFKESLNDDENAIEVTLEYMMKPSRARQKGKTSTSTIGGIATPGIGLLPGIVANPGNLISPAFGVASSVFGAFSPPPTPTLTTDGKDTGALPINAGWVGKPLFGVDPTRGVAPPTRGMADQVRLIAAALNDPCGTQLTTQELTPGYTPSEMVQTNPDGSTLTVNQLTPDQPPDDLDGKYGDGMPGVWDHYIVRTSYHDDSGKRILPATGTNTSASVVQMHGAYMRCKLEWSVARVGGPPIIPAKETSDPNVVYLYGDVEQPNIEPAADGVSLRHEMSGVYYYGFLNRNAAVVAAPIPQFVQQDLTRGSPGVLLAASPVGSSGGPAANSAGSPPSGPSAEGGPTSFTGAGAGLVVTAGNIFTAAASPASEPTNTGGEVGVYEQPAFAPGLEGQIASSIGSIYGAYSGLDLRPGN